MGDIPALIGFAAWVLGAASLVFTALLGIILTYHWYRYAMNPVATSIALSVYVAVSAAVLSGMFTALLIFSA